MTISESASAKPGATPIVLWVKLDDLGVDGLLTCAPRFGCRQVVRPDLIHNPSVLQALEDMLSEARIMSTMGSHANVIGFFGVFPSALDPVIVVECMEGPALLCTPPWSASEIERVDFSHDRLVSEQSCVFQAAHSMPSWTPTARTASRGGHRRQRRSHGARSSAPRFTSSTTGRRRSSIAMSSPLTCTPPPPSYPFLSSRSYCHIIARSLDLSFSG